MREQCVQSLEKNEIWYVFVPIVISIVTIFISSVPMVLGLFGTSSNKLEKNSVSKISLIE